MEKYYTIAEGEKYSLVYSLFQRDSQVRFADNYGADPNYVGSSLQPTKFYPEVKATKPSALSLPTDHEKWVANTVTTISERKMAGIDVKSIPNSIYSCSVPKKKYPPIDRGQVFAPTPQDLPETRHACIISRPPSSRQHFEFHFCKHSLRATFHTATRDRKIHYGRNTNTEVRSSHTREQSQTYPPQRGEKSPPRLLGA